MATIVRELPTNLATVLERTATVPFYLVEMFFDSVQRWSTGPAAVTKDGRVFNPASVRVDPFSWESNGVQRGGLTFLNDATNAASALVLGEGVADRKVNIYAAYLDATGQSLKFPGPATYYAGQAYDIFLATGQQYLLSCWLFADGNGNYQIGMESGATIILGTSATIQANKWVRVSAVLDLTAHAGKYWKLRIDNEQAAGQNLWADGFMLEVLAPGQTVPAPYASPGFGGNILPAIYAKVSKEVGYLGQDLSSPAIVDENFGYIKTMVEPVPVAAGVGDSADIGLMETQINIVTAGSRTVLVPLRAYTLAGGFSHLLPSGTIITWENEKFILETR